MMGNPEQNQRGSNWLSHRWAYSGLLFAILLILAVGAAAPAHAQQYTVLHDFIGGNDGSEPAYGLTMDSSGNIYGSTFSGDTGTGTIFEATRQNSTWTLNTLYLFSGGLDGAVPYAGVTFGPDGALYGTTGYGGYGPCATWGGKTGCGTVFKLQQSGGSWTESVLFYFQQGPEGGTPYGGRLIFDEAGNLYGTAFSGGGGSCPAGCGVVYQLSYSNGSWRETVLYTFAGGNDGASPWAGVVFDQQGNLYGTTEFGGATNNGTIYKLTPSGSGWTETVLYSFRDQEDGARPFAGLTFDRAGNMYGATSIGGTSNGGTVFQLTPSGSGWNFQTLYGFTGRRSQLANGPVANLIVDDGGNIWGATGGDGTNFLGSVFRLTPTASGWAYTSLYDFMNLDDGAIPRSNLVFDVNGNIYGTAANGQTLEQCVGSCGVFFRVTNPQQLVPLPPCRVVDTRAPNGPLGGPPIPGGTSRDFPIAGNCGIPTSASAVSVNATVVPRGTLNYLTVWPSGHPQPNISLMNSPDGRVKANAAVVQTGAGGSISVYATDTTDVIVDVDGYFILPGAAPQGTSTLTYYALPPCRVADTRGPVGGLGGPALVGGQERDFPVLDASSCGIPSSAKAYSLNVTAVPRGTLNFLTVWPAGQSRPTVSTLNAPTGTATANAAVVTAGSAGAVAVYATDDTDLVLDIDGYFAAPGTNGLSFYPAPPCRALDTRQGSGAFNGQLIADVLNSPCQPPNVAQGYVFNATVVPLGSLGYLTLWPDSQDQPVVSTLNAYDGFVTSNMAIVPNVNGSIDAYAAGLTQLILDITGYFAP
jgi:uncharacterized repeat protein (TIGR03803 family)